MTLPRLLPSQSPSSGPDRRQVLGLGMGFLASGLIVPRAFAQGAPTRGGQIRIGTFGGTTAGTLDPTTYSTNFPILSGNCWGNQLVSVDAKMVLQPELAESWEMSDDATTWILKLRQGVEFHDGKPLQASDVLYSIGRHREETARSFLIQQFRQVADIVATGTHEITFTLQAPNVDFIYILADYHLQIQPEGGSVDGAVGTGPYVLENYQAGVSATFRRNENYWRSDAAHLDSVEILAINDSFARTSALQSGDVDLAVGVTPRLMPLLEGAGFTTYRVPGSGFISFSPDVRAAPFDNVDLRLALRYAVDREQLRASVWDNSGMIGNDHPVPTFFRYYHSELPQRPYDPEQAVYHWKNAGSPTIPPLAVSDGVFPGSLEAGELYQQQAKAAGIDLQLNRIPADGYFSNPNRGSFVQSQIAGRPSEDMLFTLMYGDGSASGPLDTNSDPAIVAMITAARAEVDEDARRQIYWDLQEVISNDAGRVIPWFQQWEVAMTPKVKGFELVPLGDGKFIENLYLEG